MAEQSSRASRHIWINTDEGNPAEAWIYLKLHESDLGEISGRTSRPEYGDRRPSCVKSFTRDGIQIEVTNAGLAASDLVVLEYELIYCSYSGHGPTDGFTTSHAGEFASDPVDLLFAAAYIPPVDSVLWSIKFPERVADWLVNLYFRGRVSTLWSEKIPKSRWDFASDPKVTEAYLRLS